MTEQSPYQIPAQTHRVETEVARSRFIATTAPAQSVAEAKTFLTKIRDEMPDASHHVYAYRVGFGNTVTESMSDDGEPAGTAGPPILSILRGSDIGDIIVVVTRYFGGTKLGTGGLVRAYSEATNIALNSLETTMKIKKRLLGIETPYNLYEQVKILLKAHEGEIQDESFTVDVMILAEFPVYNIDALSKELLDLSAGRIVPIELD